MEEQKTPFERINNWIKKSVTLKLITITFLMLLLLIPTTMIDSIISERRYLRGSAIEEVTSKWANEQEIRGPILTIPVLYEYEVKNEEGETSMKTFTKKWHILPNELKIDGQISPKELERGIYKIVVYNSKVKVGGSFKFNFKMDSTNLKKIQYDKAYLTIGISDLRGIEDHIKVRWNETERAVVPGSRISDIAYSGVTCEINGLKPEWGEEYDFSFDLNLQGSRNMTFVPLGQSTEITLNSDWTAPKFDGAFLPRKREITKDGFNAYWKVLQVNRNIPPSWFDSIDANKFKNAAFGVDLILEVDDYQKATRSSKYAVMTIALTFLIFFLVEVINRRKIHPFQYTLVGLALCLFYVLLISISEHSNFNFAYMISSLVIVGMITIYSFSVFRSPKLSILLTAALAGTYGFLYTTLQMTDYALLMGSIGLTIILAATMYFTRNINWYKISEENE